MNLNDLYNENHGRVYISANRKYIRLTFGQPPEGEVVLKVLQTLDFLGLIKLPICQGGDAKQGKIKYPLTYQISPNDAYPMVSLASALKQSLSECGFNVISEFTSENDD